MTLKITGWWDVNQAAVLSIANTPFDKYDYMVCHSALIDENGDVDATTRPVETYATDFVAACVADDCVPLLGFFQSPVAAITGPPAIAASAYTTTHTAPSTIDNMIGNVVSYAQSKGFEGIVTDWESNIVESQWVAMHEKFREHWPGMYLSTYFAVNHRGIAHDSETYCDELMLNTYDSHKTDFGGSGVTVAWHNSATTGGSPYTGLKTGEGFLYYAFAEGLDPAKLSLAVPFYARILEDPSVPQDPGDSITDKDNWDAGTYTFQQIQDLSTWANRLWDSTSNAPYIPDSLNVGYVSYSDAQHMLYYANLADENSLRGLASFAVHQEYLSAEVGDAKYPMSTQLRASGDYAPPDLLDSAVVGTLVQGERTNRLRYGEKPVITGSYWQDLTGLLSTKSGILLDFGSPDGSTDIIHYGADDTSNTTHQCIQQYTGIADENITLSGYFHAAEEEWVCLLLGDTDTVVWSIRHWFNLNLGTVGASELDIGTGTYVSATIEQVGTDDSTGYSWYRCSLTVTPPASATGFSARIITTDTDGVSSYAATAAGDGVYLWGLSAEEGSFASTPLIKTPGAVAVTVPATTGLDTSITTIGAPLTITREFKTGLGGIDTEVAYQIDDGTTNNYIRIAREAGTLYVRFRTSGAEVAALNLGALANDTVAQVAVTCEDNDFRASLNQGTPVTDIVGTAPTGLNRESIGYDHTPDNYLYGYHRSGSRWSSVITEYLTAWPPEIGGNNFLTMWHSSEL